MEEKEFGYKKPPMASITISRYRVYINFKNGCQKMMVPGNRYTIKIGDNMLVLSLAKGNNPGFLFSQKGKNVIGMISWNKPLAQALEPYFINAKETQDSKRRDFVFDDVALKAEKDGSFVFNLGESKNDG